jgi:hypothetical protein
MVNKARRTKEVMFRLEWSLTQKGRINQMCRNMCLFTHLLATSPGLSEQHQLLLYEDHLWHFPLIGTSQFDDIFRSHPLVSLL